MNVNEYDVTLPSMRKAWKEEFHNFLIEYYRPSLINAEKVFKAIGNVDNYIRKHQLGVKMLIIKDVIAVQDVKKSLLSHRPFAMGPTVSANDYKIIVLDRYIEFLANANYQNVIIPPPKDTDEDEDENLKETEGMMKEVLFFRRQRNRAIRTQCAEKYNYTCQVCGINFEDVYGETGKGFIEVHHLRPLASYDEEHEIKLEELIALCSNCHSMVHRKREVMDVNKLKLEYEAHKVTQG